MKAIIKVPKSSAYSFLNGHTFEVQEVFSTFVSLKIPSQIGEITGIDFSYNEIIIVDIDNEIQKSYDDFNFGYNSIYIHLKYYCKINNITTKEEYNCLA